MERIMDKREGNFVGGADIVKDRPIIMCGAMVRATLADAKTQTRRVVKPRKDKSLGCELAPCEIAGEVNNGDFTNCPYGRPGVNNLWVRETWAWWPADESGKREYGLIYRADVDDWECRMFRWRPSTHMSRWASRITLEITGVRVERLQEISEEDAWAEGVQDWMGKGTPWKGVLAYASVHAYAALWESINGPGSWALNPLVWVIEYKRVGA